MADSFLTLLDITKQNGTDQAVGLVEEVRTSSPEIEVLFGRPIKGTTFKSSVRKALPAGPTFRQANQGSALISSAYDQTLNQCFFMDGQMQVDEAVIKGGEFDQDTYLAREALGVLRQKALNLGSQIYYGATKDPNGFPGYASLVDTSSMVVDATGTGNTTTSAWLVVNTLDGIHLVFGNNEGLVMPAWTRQQVKDANSKAFMAWVNNLSGWVGLAMTYSKSLCRIKNITPAKPLTDALVAQALAKFPIGTVPDYIFCNRDGRLGLQTSRSAVSSALTGNMALQFAPTPVESNGIRLICTDSITTTEVAS